MKNPSNFPKTANKKTLNALYRFKFGYRCLSEITNNLPDTCQHCDRDTHAPLAHYLTESRQTAPYINRNLGTAENIIRQMDWTALATLALQFPPPR
ncbi:hypothetical protein E2C01_102123 [Portunus trituberculatus]|uniref:Uncharacterized protein n=1 Tax=Portunus trituberculatus TaxID=210409 RepID=A0A5B7KLU7_PORTR|nr:hypothetical protein [Portunus trituberculatus]